MARYNLVIPQGKTFSTTWIFRSLVVLSQDLLPDAVFPPTSINVISLTHTVASGTVLRFPIKGSCATIDLVTAAIANPGDTSISILPYTGTQKLPCKTSIAPNAVIPLTDVALVRGQIREKYDDLTALLNFTFNIQAPQGTIIQTATAAQTAALTANCKFYEIPDNPQDDTAWDKALLRKAYHWDSEIVRITGEVEELAEGRLWVKAEATK
jgi:hypothetical protein